MHQMHISLIAGVSTQIAMSISQARQVNYFPGLLSFFFFFFFFFFSLLFLTYHFGKGPVGWMWWDGAHRKAIYPPFVPLHSFKKANSLKAYQEREKEGRRERERDIDPPHFSSTSSGSSWLRLRMQCFINVLWSLEDMRTVPNEFSQEDERKRGECEAYRADIPQQRIWKGKT